MRDFLGSNQAALRIRRNQRRQRVGFTATGLAHDVGNGLPHDVGVRITRADRIDGDVLGSKLQGQRACETDDRVFRGHVRRDVSAAAQSGDTRDIDDAPETNLEHVRNGLPGAQVGAVNVHGHDPVPQRLVRIREFRARRLARVVDEDLNRAEVLARLLESGAYGSAVGYVRDDRGRDGRSAQRFRDGVQILSVSAEQGHSERRDRPGPPRWSFRCHD